MLKYIKQFANHTAYQSAESNLDKPNVSLCVQEDEIHYNPILPKATVRLTFNVSEPGKERISVVGDFSPFGGIANADGLSNVQIMNVDGVEVDIENDITRENIVDAYGIVIDGYFYNFTTNGQHTIEYILNDMTVNEGICAMIGDFEYFGFLFPSKITNVSVEVNANTIEALSFGYSYAIENVTIGSDVTYIDDNAFEDCGNLTFLTLNANAATNGVFKDLASITNVVISNNVTSIGDYAFQNCTNLSSITIPNSIVSIGSYAFNNCDSLSSITIPNSVTSIGNNAFDNCDNLTSITIPNSITTINNNTFSNCSSLTSITIPNNITSIGNSAFSGSGLTSIIIPNSVISIGSSAFSNCVSLTSVTIPNSITSINNYTFQSCSSLTSITIPDSVTSIGEGAFRYCESLLSITINNGTIGEGAFNGCYQMTSVTIGSGVTSIGYCTFQSCSALRSITSFATTAPSIDSSSFYRVRSNGTLIVPTGSSGYDVWMRTESYFLGSYNWTKVEQ